MSGIELSIFEEINFEEVWEEGVHFIKLYSEAHEITSEEQEF